MRGGQPGAHAIGVAVAVAIRLTVAIPDGNAVPHAPDSVAVPAGRRHRDHEPHRDDHLDELGTLAGDGKLTLPCGVVVEQPALRTTAPCMPADEIAAWLEANQEGVALLPAGLVEPATKVLSITGDGPFGLFGPDLFGDPESRALSVPGDRRRRPR